MDWNKEVTFVASKKAELKVQKKEKNLWWWRVASKSQASCEHTSVDICSSLDILLK